jgi:hypothetical protein
MPNIPVTQKFHTVSGDVDTENKGSALANSDRAVFTMQDIINTVDAAPGSGTIGGSIAAGQIAFGGATANTIEGNATITTNGTNVFIPDFIVHTGDSNAFFGFNSDDNFQVQTNGNVQIQVTENHVALHHKDDGEKIRTKANGVLVTGQMDLATLNAEPVSSSDTGTLGEIRWVADAVYLCIATDTWVKADLATF